MATANPTSETRPSSRLRAVVATVAAALLPAACAGPAGSTPDRPDAARGPTVDQHSFARLARTRVTHVALDLTADFAARVLRGTASLRLDRDSGDDTVVLDTHGLEIAAVRGADRSPRAFRFGAEDPILGRSLSVTLEPDDRRIDIEYATRPGAEAVQWLTPEQTHDGERPFLFTQGQAILTRTWIPLQDTPGVRQTYDATIRVPPELGVVAVMSAESRVVAGPGEFRFAMSRPIPSYLIALAIGRLEERAISERCAVWAEPGVVAGAAAEFEDTERMLQVCERLFGPYRWGRYDILVLPPAFPFGGMENPCLTFATPTILAGDKSLVALIAHELAHSWSGNLVTNATWRDFWLNEGFTVLLEQRIVEEVFGEARAAMETLHGLRGLEAELAELPPDDQILWIDLTGRNPDDGMTAVPYDKGAAFLRRLEQVFGRVPFDRFLTEWFDEHAFRSVTTDDFLRFLHARLLDDAPHRAAEIDVDAWVFGAGLPADCPRPASPAFALVDDVRTAWIDGREPAASLNARTSAWVTMQWLHFLGGIAAADVGPDRLAELDDAFGFTKSGNAEIVAAWLAIAIRGGYAAADARLEEFLLTVGRRKFLKPLYEALAATPSGLERARGIYARARPRYHAVSTRTIDEVLGVGGG